MRRGPFPGTPPPVSPATVQNVLQMHLGHDEIVQNPRLLQHPREGTICRRSMRLKLLFEDPDELGDLVGIAQGLHSFQRGRDSIAWGVPCT